MPTLFATSTAALALLAIYQERKFCDDVKMSRERINVCISQFSHEEGLVRMITLLAEKEYLTPPDKERVTAQDKSR